ncbi:MAG: hypothetical protein HYT46_03280 [Candidatus Vogelbacteria bacterium]|nr:hypothetical protein [Candidatus Vogelbacteria bacterium]
MLNTKRGFGGVGIIIIILLAVGVGGYLLSKKSISPPAPTPATGSDNSFTTLPPPTPSAAIPLTNSAAPSPETKLSKITSAVTVGHKEDDDSFYPKCDYIIKLYGQVNKVKELNVFDTKLQIKLLERYENDPNFRRELCTKDRKFCETKDDWSLLEINGSKLQFAVEEIKALQFDNGLKIYFTAQDNDPDICIAKFQ